jgi:energy-coupling factor transporter ATP-binding protein EcfA2
VEQRVFRVVLHHMLAADAPRGADEGQLVVVSGHGGIGKSTLLRCLHGLHAIATGEQVEDAALRGVLLVLRVDLDDAALASLPSDASGLDEGRERAERLMERLADLADAATSATDSWWRRRKMVWSAFENFREELAEARRQRVSALQRASALPGGAGGRGTEGPEANPWAIAGSAVGAVVSMTPEAPRTADRLRPRVQEIAGTLAGELLDAGSGGSGVDLMRAVAERAGSSAGGCGRLRAGRGLARGPRPVPRPATGG